MFLAELDPIQIIIIVIAMGAGFVQWLWGLLKQKLDENTRRNDAPLSPEERAAREEAWRRQTQQPLPAQPQRPSPKAPPPIHSDPWSTVRDVFEQIKEEARKAQNPAEPPPLPQHPAQNQAPSHPAQRPRRGSVRAELHPAPPPPPADPFPVGSVKNSPATTTPPVFFATAPTPPLLRPDARNAGPDFRGLRQLLHSPASLKQAVLFREILGPPKALQSSSDSPF